MVANLALRCILVSCGLLIAGVAAIAQAPAPNTPAAPAPGAPAPAPAPGIPPALIPAPFDEALQKAVTSMMTGTAKAAQSGASTEILVDPLIDPYTGGQNATTTAMGGKIVQMIRSTYPQFKVVKFSAANLSKEPLLLLLGTFRPVNSKNDEKGPRDVFHICLTMIDLKTGIVVGKGPSRALPQGVNLTPTPFFQDAPVWASDTAVSSYVKACQTTPVGDRIDQPYADRLVVASLITDATDAYDAKRYADALALYQSALRTPGGDQLRVHTGIYLANWRLQRKAQAEAAFAALVDYGLKGAKLGVNFLFNPNSTIFYRPKGGAVPYEMWLKTIGTRADTSHSCLEIVGHTSKSGAPAINDRLSVLRAQYVRDRLLEVAPSLGGRTLATGVGSRETIVGTETDGPFNAIDRRVEFKTVKCSV